MRTPRQLSRSMCLRITFLTALVFVTAVSGRAQSTSTSDSERIVRAFVDAFNRHKADEMLQLVTDDIQWVAIEGPKASVHLEGKPTLKREMEQYFHQCASCKSTLKWVQSTGSRITALEEASWMVNNVLTSQRSLSVYEFTEGRIARVFYFPVERE